MRVHSGNSVALLSSEWRLMIRVGDGDWQTLWIDCMSPKCGREISWECRYCMSVSYILVQWHWQKSMDASGFGVPSSKGKGGMCLPCYIIVVLQLRGDYRNCVMFCSKNHFTSLKKKCKNGIACQLQRFFFANKYLNDFFFT